MSFPQANAERPPPFSAVTLTTASARNLSRSESFRLALPEALGWTTNGKEQLFPRPQAMLSRKQRDRRVDMLTIEALAMRIGDTQVLINRLREKQRSKKPGESSGRNGERSRNQRAMMSPSSITRRGCAPA